MNEPRYEKGEVDLFSLTHQTHTRISTCVCQMTGHVRVKLATMWCQQNMQLHVKLSFSEIHCHMRQMSNCERPDH